MLLLPGSDLIYLIWLICEFENSIGSLVYCFKIPKRTVREIARKQISKPLPLVVLCTFDTRWESWDTVGL